jgi:Icc-related predicted phosphoesterase
MFFKRKGHGGEKVKILFTSDVHGSDIVFRKFLNAGLIYEVDALIIGGDIAGKALHPIIDLGGGKYEHNDEVVTDLDSVIKSIRSRGEYYTIVSKEEYEEMIHNKALRDEHFKRAMIDVIKGWDKIAAEKLKERRIPIYVNLGNDDPEYLFDALRETEHLRPTEGEVIDIKGHEMISFGYVNPTPWNTPRELPEDELYKRLKAEADKVSNVEKAIFNIHAPPINTNLDNAPLLDNDLKPVVKGGMIVYVHVGSVAVRKVIEEYQPLIGLHGHIHESRGYDKIGRTMVFNPGSEYNDGILHAVYVVLEGASVKAHQFIIG